jgi:hypothetical protein
MSLPYRQQWQLRHIDHALRRSDPKLAAMLAIFTRLTAGEKIWDAERLHVPSRRLLTRLLGSAVVLGYLVLRGVAWTGGRITAALRTLRSVPLLRRAHPADGTSQPGLRRTG